MDKEIKDIGTNYYIRRLTSDDVLNIYKACQELCHFTGDITSVNMPGPNDNYISINREGSTDIFISDFNIARHTQYPEDAAKALDIFRAYMHQKFGEQYLIECVRSEFSIDKMKERLAKEKVALEEQNQKIDKIETEISMALINANEALQHIKAVSANIDFTAQREVPEFKIPDVSDVIALNAATGEPEDKENYFAEASYSDIEDESTEEFEEP